MLTRIFRFRYLKDNPCSVIFEDYSLHQLNNATVVNLFGVCDSLSLSSFLLRFKLHCPYRCSRLFISFPT